MSKALKPIRPLSDFLRVLAAPVIWFMHLVVIYGAEALICIGPTASGTSAMVWVVTLATAVALTGLAAALFAQRGFIFPGKSGRSSSQFLSRTALILTGLSGLAVIWATLPIAMLPACAAAGG